MSDQQPLDRLAHLLTEALAPRWAAPVALGLVAWHSAPTRRAALGWTLAAAALSPSSPVMAFVDHQVRRGTITDIHVGQREQRAPVLVLAGLSTLAVAGLLRAVGAPPALIATLGTGLIALVVVLAITLAWKISLHVGVLAGLTVVLTQLLGPSMLALAPLVAAVAWSRVHLGAHTGPQVLAGGLVGALVTGTVFRPLLNALQQYDRRTS